MMSSPEQIRALAEAMKETWEDQSAPTIMSALTLVTAEVLASCDMMEGKDINAAMAAFDRQVRLLYALLTKDMRS